MISDPSTQKISKLLSGSFDIYRRSFVKLFSIFLISLAALAFIFIYFLPTYVDQLDQTVQTGGQVAIYTAIYALRPMLENGVLEWTIAIFMSIGVFTSPLFMGIAGKLVSDQAKGKKSSLREAAVWTRNNYKKLLSVYAIYYIVLAAFGGAFVGAMYWLIRVANHIISDAWLNPTFAMFVVVSVLLLLGTIYVPFGVIEDGKSGFRAYAHSFRVMYSKSFLKNVLPLLLVAVMAGIFIFLAFLPIASQLFFGKQYEALSFLIDYNNDLKMIIISIAACSLAGVFLFIIAYNTYRQANTIVYRKKKLNDNAYRRKINTVPPSDRRRVG